MSVTNETDVSLIRKDRKAILFNYAGKGEHRREMKNWLRVRELGIDGMLTDYALECAKLWQANPLEYELRKSHIAQKRCEVLVFARLIQNHRTSKGHFRTVELFI